MSHASTNLRATLRSVEVRIDSEGALGPPHAHVREDYSTHRAMASRATKGVVLNAMNSHRVLRDHVRKDQLSVTRCTVHPSHSLAARPPIVASIEHFHPHPEVTRYGDEL